MSGDPGRARLWTALCAGLHDVGKLSGFQLCDARARAQLSAGLAGDLGRIGVERMPHEVAGMHAVAEVLAALGVQEGGVSVNGAVRRVGEIIGGHHGRFHEYGGLHPANLDLLGVRPGRGSVSLTPGRCLRRWAVRCCQSASRHRRRSW